MASWSKRYTQTYKSSNNRTTRTNNSKGYSTNSTSYKSGSTRVTTSTNSKTGKQKVYTTVTNPVLGRMTTSRTTNPTVRVKKPTTWKPKKIKQRKGRAMTSEQRAFAAQEDKMAMTILAWSVVGIIVLLVLLSSL